MTATEPTGSKSINSASPQGEPDPQNSDIVDVPIPVEDAFEAISADRRRFIICYVEGVDTEVAAGELAREIAADEDDVRPESISGDRRNSVYVSLIQNHLQKLDSLNAVDYDERAKTVEQTEVTRPLACVIRGVEQRCTATDG